MLPVIGEVFSAHGMVRANRKGTFLADQGEVVRHRDGTVVEEHVVVGTQTEDIVLCVRTVVR